jgi:malate dehydrogenase (oxaloacetate-decarboxylating)(NADP+)
VIAAMMLEMGDADALLCGAVGQFGRHLHRLIDIIGLKAGVKAAAALQVLVLSQGTVFLADTDVAADPDAEAIADLTMLAATEVRSFGLTPKVALVSHSNFGSSDAPAALKMRRALKLVTARNPDFEVDGEMKADAALSEKIREKIYPGGRLRGAANLLIMPNLDAANIAVNLLRELGDGISVGPILLGMSKSAHVVSSTTTVRGLVNMSALAVLHAQEK